MRKMIGLLVLLLGLLGAAQAEGMGYEMLPEAFQAFFSKEEYRDSTFYFPDEYAMWADYHRDTPWTTFPIAHETNGTVGLHVLTNEAGAYELMTCSENLGIELRSGEKVDRVHYWKVDSDGRYWEDIQISLFGGGEPWDRSYCFERTDRADPQGWFFQSVSYQYNGEMRVPLSGEIYNYMTVSWYEGALTFSYAYMEESVESVTVPLPEPLRLDAYQADMTPEVPDALMTEAAVDTARHGNGKTLTMRAKPVKDGEILLRIPNSAQILAADMSGEWTLAKYEGTYGYVMSKFIAGSDAYMQ